MKTLIEIHALQNYAPSNLNRDDTGAPKDAIFGGHRRARISSQCQKHAVRSYFGELVEAEKLPPETLAVRTKRLRQEMIDRLERMGRQADMAKGKATSALASAGLAVKEDGKTEYLLFLGEREIAALADIVHAHWEAIPAESAPVDTDAATSGGKKTKTKNKGNEQIGKEIQDVLKKVLDGGKAAAVALFGRMLADMPEANQDAACQVAHAISTHAVEREFDFYTAIDDLKPDDTAGADMMGTIEFNAACYYRYAALDFGKLAENLQGDKDLARTAALAFLEGFILSEPTGKQNTFAAHNPPEFVFVTFGGRMPRNLANAFETPVRVPRGKGSDMKLTEISAKALLEQVGKLDGFYGVQGRRLSMGGDKVDVNGAKAESVISFEELLSRVEAWLREG